MRLMPPLTAALAGLFALPASAHGPAGHTPARRPCRPGYVWRQAGPADLVCVEPWSRDRVRQENAETGRHAAAAHPGRPAQCLAGYVPRAAYAGDAVCVTPTSHAQAQDENALAASRLQP